MNIFIFGGSTAFGYGVADQETIASYLQEICRTKRKNINVYNFACGFYYSTQERILLEKLISKGIDIDIAVFIDGVNEKGKDEGSNGPTIAAVAAVVAIITVLALMFFMKKGPWAPKVHSEELPNQHGVPADIPDQPQSELGQPPNTNQ